FDHHAAAREEPLSDQLAHSTAKGGGIYPRALRGSDFGERPHPRDLPQRDREGTERLGCRSRGAVSLQDLRGQAGPRTRGAVGRLHPIAPYTPASADEPVQLDHFGAHAIAWLVER